MGQELYMDICLDLQVFHAIDYGSMISAIEVPDTDTCALERSPMWELLLPLAGGMTDTVGHQTRMYVGSVLEATSTWASGILALDSEGILDCWHSSCRLPRCQRCCWHSAGDHPCGETLTPPRLAVAASSRQLDSARHRMLCRRVEVQQRVCVVAGRAHRRQTAVRIIGSGIVTGRR